MFVNNLLFSILLRKENKYGQVELRPLTEFKNQQAVTTGDEQKMVTLYTK